MYQRIRDLREDQDLSQKDIMTATLPDSIRFKCSRLIPAMTASFVWDTPYCKRLSAKSCIHSVSFSVIPPLQKNCDIFYPMSQQ